MKSLLLLSGKGGTGKTTTASAFIRFSNAQAMADCDVDAPNLHLIYPFEKEPIISDFYGSPKYEIVLEACTRCGACASVCRFDAIEQHEDGSYVCNPYFCEGCGVCAYACPSDAIFSKEDVAGTLSVSSSSPVFSTATLKMGRGNSGKLVTAVKQNLQKHVSNEMPLAILDGSPGTGCPVIASVTGVDFVLFVAEPSKSGLHDLKRVCQTVDNFATPFAVCINKYDVSLDGTKEIEAFCKENSIACLGKIPYDKTVSQAINEGKSIADYACPARTALQSIFEKTMDLMEVER